LKEDLVLKLYAGILFLKASENPPIEVRECVVGDEDL
jgi:hypothetical protein